MKGFPVITLLAALLLSGCGGQPSSTAAGPELAVARVKDAVGLDPSHETDGMSLNITSEIFANLVKFKPGTFEVVPDIARSWYATKDGKHWTFTLNPGLKFSDGTPLDAAAVKFNFDRWRLKNGPYHGNFPYGYYASQFGGFPGAIVDVEAPSPNKVTFTLAAPLGPFLRNLAMPSFGIGSPTAIRKDPQNFGQAPVASGPYTLGEWVKDDHITLLANPLWAGPKPAYGTVIVRDIPDQSTSRALDEERRRRHFGRSASGRRARSRAASRHQALSAAQQQRLVPGAERRPEAVRQRPGAARHRVRDRREGDRDRILRVGRDRRRQLDAAGNAR